MRLEYPKKLYHQDGRVVRVQDAAEHDLYRAGWAESPKGPFPQESHASRVQGHESENDPGPETLEPRPKKVKRGHR